MDRPNDRALTRTSSRVVQFDPRDYVRLELRGLFYDPKDLRFYPEVSGGDPVSGDTFNAVCQLSMPSDLPWSIVLASPYAWPTSDTVNRLGEWLRKQFPTITFEPIDDTPPAGFAAIPKTGSAGRIDIFRVEDFRCTGLGVEAEEHVSLQNLWRSLLNAGEETTARNLRTLFVKWGILI